MGSAPTRLSCTSSLPLVRDYSSHRSLKQAPMAGDAPKPAYARPRRFISNASYAPRIVVSDLVARVERRAGDP